MVRTKAEWMDYLAGQLYIHTPVSYASRYTLSPNRADEMTPYIGIVAFDEREQQDDGYDSRYIAPIALFLVTDQENHDIEDIVGCIKSVLPTLDLGDNVYQIKFVSSDFVSIEESDTDSGRSTATTQINLEVVYSLNTSGVQEPLPEARTGGLTEPVGKAHYKIYALLSSGSFSSQPLGTNVYASNNKAAIDIPQGSGSILVGVNADLPFPTAVAADEFLDDHRINVIVDIPTGYNGQAYNFGQTVSMTDNVVNKLRTNTDLGEGYRIYDPGVLVEQIIDELNESETIGARINVTVRKWFAYDQE